MITMLKKLVDQEGFGIIHKPFDLDVLSKEIQRFMQVGTTRHEKAA